MRILLAGLRATLIALLPVLALAGPATSQEPLVRRFAADQGLAVPPVMALAQDRDGLIWVGALGGLYRFDGVEFRRWAPDLIIGGVEHVATADDGRVAARLTKNELFEVVADEVRRIPPPPAGWHRFRPSVAYSSDGRLWAIDGDESLVVQEGGSWAIIERNRFDGEAVRGVLRAGGSDMLGAGADSVIHAVERGVLVRTESGLWHLESPAASPRRVFDSAVVDATVTTDGRLIALTVDNRVFELVDGRAREVASAGQLPDGRAIAVIERKGTIWVAQDRFLAALREGRATRVIGSLDGLDSGGPLLVDHEGSLWMGGFSALVQLPEPETTVWYERGGLPGRHMRFLAWSEGVLWVTSWQGTGKVVRAASGPRAETVDELASAARPCADELGTVWIATDSAVYRVRGERIVQRLPAHEPFTACARASGPGLWIGTLRGLLFADARSGTLRPIAGLPTGEGVAVDAVHEDRAGRLWITHGERACHAPAAAVRALGDLHALDSRVPDSSEPGPGPSAVFEVDWRCEPLPSAGLATAFHELDDGTLWVATRQAGVLARDERGWRRLPANDELATGDVFALVPSPSGGIWIAGQGILQRVIPGGPRGWSVVEAPGPGNGLAAGRGADLAEDDDGTLWIATSIGLVHVPPEARRLPLDPPRVLLVDARVDDEPVRLADGLVLAADRNRLELRFAALSYREPGRVRYQVRLSPEAPWIGTLGQPSFRWVDLPPGSYRAEVRASLDGRNWSEAPAHFEFRVLPPWHRTPWALGLFAALAGAGLWGAYRARTAYLVGLERQRTQIAMDLHDELGSGLGSIGILAGLLPSERVGEAQRGRIAGEIAETAAELGHALADIVWSLDPRAATLEELAARLAEHGDRLFPGDDVVFRIVTPREWPAAELPLTLRRNLLLIGVEALHNAARHARARHVTLEIGPRQGFWELRLHDDGVGLDTDSAGPRRRGRGLAGMRRRAEEIGAVIEWTPAPGGGTTVRLRFAVPGTVRRARAHGRRR